jgi:iron complex outermembrane receptor protein
MMPTLRHATIAAFALLAAAPAPAEEPDSVAASPAEAASADSIPAFEMSLIEIQADRPVVTVGGAAAIEVHTDSLDIPPAASVEEVFRELPFLHLRTNSRGEAEISARGSESRQVAVLVDGVPITLAWDARADVSVIPATAIREAVFVRGLSSVLHGPNVLGGVVETRVAHGADQPEESSTQITLGADHVGSFGTTVAHTAPFRTDGGNWLVRAGAGFRDTPGDPLAKDVTERRPDDDLRLNTDARDADGFLALRYRDDGGAWFSFSGASFRAERGIAAELGAPDDDARFWRYPEVRRTLAVVSGGTGDRKSPFGGRGDLEASFGVDVGRSEIDSYPDADYDVPDSFEHGEDRTFTLRMLGDQTLGAHSDLRGAFTFAEVRHDESIPDGDFRYRQQLWSLGVENVWRIFESAGTVDQLALSTGLVYDISETREAGGREPLGPKGEGGGRIGLELLTRDGAVAYHAGVSRRARFPALRELYSGALDRFQPNPDLQAEKVVTVEAGVTLHRDGADFQAVAFHNRVDDAVVRTTLPDRRFFRVNRDELRTVGLELLGRYPAGRFSLSGNLVIQNAELTDTSTDEQREPESLPSAFGSLDAKVRLGRGFTAGAGADYTGDQFAIDVSTGEDTRLDAAVLFGAWIGREWKLPASFAGRMFTRMDTRIAADNLADKAHYEIAGIPEPGRRFRFELRLR